MGCPAARAQPLAARRRHSPGTRSALAPRPIVQHGFVCRRGRCSADRCAPAQRARRGISGWWRSKHRSASPTPPDRRKRAGRRDIRSPGANRHRPALAASVSAPAPACRVIPPRCIAGAPREAGYAALAIVRCRRQQHAHRLRRRQPGMIASARPATSRCENLPQIAQIKAERRGCEARAPSISPWRCKAGWW